MQKTNIISFVLGVITGGVVGGYITKKYVEYRDNRLKEEYEEKTEKYIIKKIDTTLGVSGTQNITMMKYYPLYPWG